MSEDDPTILKKSIYDLEKKLKVEIMNRADLSEQARLFKKRYELEILEKEKINKLYQDLKEEKEKMEKEMKEKEDVDINAKTSHDKPIDAEHKTTSTEVNNDVYSSTEIDVLKLLLKKVSEEKSDLIKQLEIKNKTCMPVVLDSNVIIEKHNEINALNNNAIIEKDNEINALKELISKLNEDHSILQKKFELEIDELKNIQLTTSVSDITVSVDPNLELLNKILFLEKELESKNDSTPANKDDTTVVSVNEVEILNYEAKILSLEKQIEDLKAQSVIDSPSENEKSLLIEIEELESKQESLHLINNQKMEEMLFTNLATVATLQKEIDSLKEENAKLVLDISSSKTQIEAVNSESARYQRQILELEEKTKQFSALSVQIRNLEASVVALTTSRDDLSIQLRKANEEKTAAAKESDTLRNLLKVQTTSNSKLETQVRQLNAMVKEKGGHARLNSGQFSPSALITPKNFNKDMKDAFELVNCQRCNNQYREYDNCETSCGIHTGEKVVNTFGFKYYSCCLQDANSTKPCTFMKHTHSIQLFK